MNKDVEIVIPCFNSNEYILQAVNSVLTQTVPVNKIIIVDDCSTDESLNLLKRTYGHNPRIQVIKLTHHAGPSKARNAGILKCSSTFVALLDADDVWLPNKLEQQLKSFTESKLPNLGLVYSGYSLINENGTSIEGKEKIVAPKLRGKIFKQLLGGNYISGSNSSVLVRRSVFDDVGVFDEHLVFGEDWDMWLRISEKYSFEFVNKPLVEIRRHATNSQNNIIRSITDRFYLLNKWDSKGIVFSNQIGTYLFIDLMKNCKLDTKDGFRFISTLYRTCSTGTRRNVFNFSNFLMFFCRPVYRTIKWINYSTKYYAKKTYQCFASR